MFRNPELMAPQAGMHKSLNWALFFASVAFLSMVVPVVGHTLVFACAVAFAICVVAPIWIRYQRGGIDAFETIHVIGLLYFAFYALGSVWAVTDDSKIVIDKFLVPYIPRAALYCLLGYMAMMTGYFGPWFRKRNPRRIEDWPTSFSITLVPGVIGFVGFMSLSALSRASWATGVIPKMFSSLAQFTPLFLFAWSLSWLLLFSGRSTKQQRAVLFLFLVPAAVLVLSARLNSKSLPMFLIGAPIIALWYARRKLPWVTLVVLLLVLVFAVFPFFNTYRLTDPRLATGTRVGMTWEVISDWDMERYLDRSIDSFKFRMAMINSVAVVVRDVPRWVPYARGETIFLPAVQFFIPRWLWPDKPFFLLGRQFGETFRAVHILDETTSVAVTVPGELYWNFDLPGILFGMAIFGVTLRFLYRRYGEAEGLDPFRRAIHIVLLIQLTYFDGGLAANYVTVIRTLIIFEVLRLVARNLRMIESRKMESIHG